MISKVLLDSYPDIKKQACNLIITSSQYLRNKIGHTCTAIVKSLAKNLGHQHSKVRKITMKVNLQQFRNKLYLFIF